MSVLPAPPCRGRRAALVMLLLAVLPGLAPPVLGSAPPGASAVQGQPPGVWPLDPRPSVVASFAPPADPWSAGHRGVDLVGTPGQVVRSALPGTVGFVGSIGGKPVVTVIHGSRRTTYEPVVGSLERGDLVRTGDPIGRLVVAASHCFPTACLHWGLRRGEEYLDPLSLVGGGRVRLLPLWRESPAHWPAESRPWTPLLSVWLPVLDVLVRRADGPGGRPGAIDRW